MHPFSVIFFVIYLIITLYIIANVVSLCMSCYCGVKQLTIIAITATTTVSLTTQCMSFTLQILAVIYSSFSDAAKKKFKGVFVHKR